MPADRSPTVAVSEGRWVRDTAVMVALVIAGTIACLIRVPAAHQDIVWAEDGNIFLYEHKNLGFWDTLFRGYAGYQHLVPRLGAGFVLRFFPLETYAVAVFVVCSLITGLVAAAIYWLSRDVIRWVPGRVAVASITLVIPLATQEVIGNLADIHSYFMWLAPWLFFYRPRSWLAGSLWGIAAFLTVMTEVQSIIFLPLALFLLTPRHRFSWPIIGAFIAGAAWQLVTVLTVDRDTVTQWLGIPSIVQGWLINTVMPLAVANPDSVRHQLQQSGLLIPLVVMIPFVIAFVIAIIWGNGRQRTVVITLALASAAIYAGGAVVDGSWWFRYAEGDAAMWERLVNARYGVSSGMMLAGIVPVAASIVFYRPFTATWARTMGRLMSWSAVVGLIVILALASTRAVSVRGDDGSDGWSASVKAAVEACASHPADAVVTLPVAPGRIVTLTCAQATE